MKEFRAVLFLMAVLLPTAGPATPFRAAVYDQVSHRQCTERQDWCHLVYYNFCSGWLWDWQGYCYSVFPEPGYPPAMYGTCFDLGNCSGDCHHLETVWWACRSYYWYGVVDVEVFCADEDACPAGPVLAGIYGCTVTPYGWQRFDFGGLPLCECDRPGGSCFIVMITDYTAPWITMPYSDLNSRNMAAGCENEWRCQGHSFVYRNLVSYCAVYGQPGPLWISWMTGPEYGCTNYPGVPPGCHTWYGPTGYYSEWLIDCYISCLGPTKTEEQSWSEIKALYR